MADVTKINIEDINNSGVSGTPDNSAFTGFVDPSFKPIEQVLDKISDDSSDKYSPDAIYKGVNTKRVVNNRLSRLKNSETFYSAREKQAFLSSLVSQARKTKKEIIESVDAVRDMYLVGAILELYDEEATAKSNDAFNLVDISSSNPVIQRYAAAFQREIDIDALVGSFTEDLCAYGEYILRVNPDPNNFQVFDDVIQADVVAVYKSSQLFPEYFLSGLLKTDINRDMSDLIRKSSINYVHFCLGKRKIKIIVNAKDLSGVRITKYPYYVRIGKSLIYNVLDKLLQLDLLEKLAPMSLLSSLSGSNLIGIQVPDSMDPKTVFETTRKYEKMLNGVFDLENVVSLTGDIDPDQLIANASRYKVVPLWGDKGQMERLELQKEIDTTESIEDTRNTILSTVSVPAGLLYGGTESKGETLKQYSRFVKKLMMIRQAIRSGVMQMFIIYLSAHGITANPQEINIKLTNPLIDVSQFDRLEATDMVATIIKNIIDMYSSVQDFISNNVTGEEEPEPIFKKKELLSSVANILGSTGFGEAIKIPNDEEPPVDADIDSETEDDSEFSDDEFSDREFSDKEEPEEEGSDEFERDREKPVAGTEEFPENERGELIL